MPRRPRRLGRVLAASGFAADVDVISVTFDNDTTATRTFPAFRAVQRMKLRAATYAQEADAAGTSILVKIRNATRALDLTATIDAAPLAALAGADFVLVATDSDLIVNKADFVTVVSTVTAGTVAPAETTVQMEFALLG